jgi:hypothetical protein
LKFKSPHLHESSFISPLKLFIMQLPLIKNNHALKLVIIIMVLGLLSGCVKDHPFPSTATGEPAKVVYDWYKLIIRIQLRTSPAPIVIKNNRDFGYIGVGLYEAVRPGIKKSVSLSSILYQMPSMPEPETHENYLWSASANAALASMFRQFFVGLTDANKASIDSLENAYINRFKSITSDAVINRSQAYGRSVATAIYNWSTTDNFNLSSTGYVLPVFPGSWVPTPPAFASPVGPFLKDSRPFLQSSLTATITPLPFPYSEGPSSQFYTAVKEVYDIGKALTPEQKTIANFWADVGGPGVGYPGPGHIISIVTSVLEKKEVDLGQAAEIYAKTGIAFKDAFCRIWRIKFHHNLLRPVTYINQHIDPAWQAFLITPPYPEFPSGLAGVYTPAMRVLTRAFGDIPVTDNTYVWNGSAPRQYASFTKLAQEAAISRLYGGIHYRFTQNITLEIGQKFGDEIANINLVSPKH